MAWLVAAVLAGCAAPRWNAVREARGDAELQRIDREVEAYRRELVKREESLRALQESVGTLDLRIAEVQSERAAAAQHLSRELATLAALEEDLEAARQRGVGIEEQLAGVRKLEKELANRQQRLQEFNGQIAAKDQELASARKALEAKVAQTDAALAEVAAARATAEQRAATVAAAAEALRGALESTASLFPPPAPDPAAGGEGKGADAGK